MYVCFRTGNCLSVTTVTIITLRDVYLSLSIRFDTYLDAWAPI